MALETFKDAIEEMEKSILDYLSSIEVDHVSEISIVSENTGIPYYITRAILGYLCHRGIVERTLNISEENGRVFSMGYCLKEKLTHPA